MLREPGLLPGRLAPERALGDLLVVDLLFDAVDLLFVAVVLEAPERLLVLRPLLFDLAAALRDEVVPLRAELVDLRAELPLLRPEFALLRVDEPLRLELRVPVDLLALLDLDALALRLETAFFFGADFVLLEVEADLLEVDRLLLDVFVPEALLVDLLPVLLLFVEALLLEPLEEPDFVLELAVLVLFRAEPLFLPPPSCLFTVAHARRSASFSESPRFS